MNAFDLLLPMSEQDRLFYREVLEWATEACPADIRDRARRWPTFAMPIHDLKTWQRILYEKGWAVPHWPVEHGGCGWPAAKMAVFKSALMDASTPRVYAGEGPGQFGPVLAHFGTEKQKAEHLQGLLSGDVVWSQGFSEPEAGSDLASLKCRAVRHGDYYLINGQKTWHSWGHVSDMMFGLFRTSTEAKPQNGITMLMVSMRSPGLSTQPIRLLDGVPVGFHEVNQVFFDDVRVPVENRIGEEGRGWGLSKIVLDYERSVTFMGAELRSRLKEARLLLDAVRAIEEPEIAKDDIERALCRFEIDIVALEATELRVRDNQDISSGKAGAQAAYIMLRGAELMQRLYEICLEMAGAHSMPFSLPPEMGLSTPPTPSWAANAGHQYLRGRVETIYGGTAEVRRNIIAKSILA